MTARRQRKPIARQLSPEGTTLTATYRGEAHTARNCMVLAQGWAWPASPMPAEGRKRDRTSSRSSSLRH